MSVPGTEGVAGVLPSADLSHDVGLTIAKRAHPFKRLLRDPVAVGCLVVLGLFVLAAIFAPLLTSADPNTSLLTNTLKGPSAGHPLGFDGTGRDVWARLVFGARTSLVGAVICLVVAVMLGVTAGLLAGYVRGKFDSVSSWASNLLMAIPGIVVLLVVMTAISDSMNVAMAVFGVLLAPGVYRLIRASVTSVREELYVDAARVAGLSDARIMRRHILPVVQAPTIIQAAGLLGLAIIVQAGLQFLGLGAATEVSWGAMLNDAFANLYQKSSLLLWPGLAIGLTVTAFSLLGNALRDSLEGGAKPRRKRRRGEHTKTTTTARRATPDTAVPTGEMRLSGDELLVLRDLRVAYPTAEGESVVVDGVSLTLSRGEVLGLVGESGSGKSQTAFSILGLLPPEGHVSAERMEFGGQELQGLDRAAMNQLRGRHIAYIPQEPMSNLDPSFRIGAQLIEPIKQHLGLSTADAKAKAIALLERVGIPEPERVYRAYPHEISGGMAQRVLIAGAVSCDPELLIADEPTTALDVTVQAEVLDLMRSLQQERNMGMILVTHDFGVVADICDHVAVMQTGRVVEDAPAATLFADPQHPYTRMLLDSTLEDSEPRPALAGGPA
jgi:peptide/nickel transport system ATP-binding protein/peptide/nickel transport system permease protein